MFTYLISLLVCGVVGILIFAACLCSLYWKTQTGNVRNEIDVLDAWFEDVKSKVGRAESSQPLATLRRIPILGQKYFQIPDIEVPAVPDSEFPETIPQRRHMGHYHHDPPLTRTGIKNAKENGVRFVSRGFEIAAVYSSPAFRCVESARNFSEGANFSGNIAIETGLYEPYHDHAPTFLKKEELIQAGYILDTRYNPLFKDIGQVPLKETAFAFQNRQAEVTSFILADYKRRHGILKKNQVIVIFGHRRSIGAASKIFMENKPLDNRVFNKIAEDHEFLFHELAEMDEEGMWTTTFIPLWTTSEQEKYARKRADIIGTKN